jgi:hypothetical protein
LPSEKLRPTVTAFRQAGKQLPCFSRIRPQLIALTNSTEKSNPLFKPQPLDPLFKKAMRELVPRET